MNSPLLQDKGKNHDTTIRLPWVGKLHEALVGFEPAETGLRIDLD